MKTDVSGYIKKINLRDRKRHRVTAFLTALSMIVSANVFWQLREIGTAMEDGIYCGVQEHTHTDKCYERVLVCDQAQSPPEEAADSAEEGTQEDNVQEIHQHTDECYETRLVCQLEEHTHTDMCGSDQTADTETEDIWRGTLPQQLTGDVRQNVVLVARSQLGYTQSRINYRISQDGSSRSYYSRYGQWYGSPYGEWNTMFTYFCMYYGGVDRNSIPYGSGCNAWAVELSSRGLLHSSGDPGLKAGDVLIIDCDLDGQADRSAVVSEVKADNSYADTIEGNVDGSVTMTGYGLNDGRICGYVSLGNRDEEKTEAENSEAEKDNSTADVNADSSALDDPKTERADDKFVFEQQSGSGINVTAVADKDTFPEGTIMTVTDVEDTQAVEAAQAYIDGTEKVIDAQAVDITFINALGEEIEPADSKSVQVKITLPAAKQLDGGEYKLLHVTDSGNVEEVSGAQISQSEARFTAESFSIYVITSSGEREVNQATRIQLGKNINDTTVGNSRESPYIVHVGDQIDVYAIVATNTSDDFWVFLNGDDASGKIIERVAYNSYTPNDDGTYREDASFFARRPGECAIALNNSVTGNSEFFSIKVESPILIKNAQGEEVDKDRIREYLDFLYHDMADSDLVHSDADEPEKLYLKNTSDKRYLMHVGDTVEVITYALKSTIDYGVDFTKYNSVLNEKETTKEFVKTCGVNNEELYRISTVYEATGPGKTEVWFNGTAFYIEVLDDTTLTHADIEIADGGTYDVQSEVIAPDGTVTRTVTSYNAFVADVNHCYLYDSSKNEINRFDKEDYYKSGTPGTTQYELTS